MENTKLLTALLGALLTGGGTYEAAKYLFRYVEEVLGRPLSPRQKRLLVLPVCAAIALAVLGVGIWLGVYGWSPDAVVLALTAGFTASQMFHLYDLKPPADDTEIVELGN